MNRGIIAFLVLLVILGLLAIFLAERGPAIFLKPPADERIAFVSDRGGYTDIWTMNTDGSDPIQVTNDSADDRLPTWSPKRTELVSVSDREEGNYEVFVCAWNGAYVRRLTTSEGTKDVPVWSPDGTEILYISSGKVFSMKRHGGTEEQYLPPVNSQNLGLAGLMMPYVYAAWSPDEKALLFVQSTDRGREAYVVEKSRAQLLAPDSEIRPLPVMVARSLDVAWAPRGERVVSAYINGNGKHGLHFVDLQTLESRDLILSEGDTVGCARPAFSPDGRKIAFEMWSVREGNPNRCQGVYVINVSGGAPKQVMAGDAREPSWSPDGKRLVCTVAREDGGRDIWRVNADGTGATNLTKGKGDNYNPAWSPAARKP